MYLFIYLFHRTKKTLQDAGVWLCVTNERKSGLPVMIEGHLAVTICVRLFPETLHDVAVLLTLHL